MHGDLTVQRADDAIGDSVGQRAQRVADGNGDLAHGQGVTVADDRRGQARSINFQHRDVGGGILTDDGGIVALVAAVQLHLYAGRAADDVGAGQDVAVLADDDAGTGTTLDVVAAEPGLAAAHLLGGDGDNTGRDDRRDLLHAHACAIGAACGGGVRAALYLLDDHLVACQARTAGDHSAAQTAAEAQRSHADAGQHAEQDLAALFLLGHGGLLRGAGIAVAVVAAVIAIAAAEAAGVAVGILLGILAGRAAGIVGRIVCARRVGGVDTAGAYVGVAALLGLLVLRGGALLGLRVLAVRLTAAGCIVIETGVIVFVAHSGRLLSLSMPTVYRLIVK